MGTFGNSRKSSPGFIDCTALFRPLANMKDARLRFVLSSRSHEQFAVRTNAALFHSMVRVAMPRNAARSSKKMPRSANIKILLSAQRQTPLREFEGRFSSRLIFLCIRRCVSAMFPACRNEIYVRKFLHLSSANTLSSGRSTYMRKTDTMYR